MHYCILCDNELRCKHTNIHINLLNKKILLASEVRAGGYFRVKA